MNMPEVPIEVLARAYADAKRDEEEAVAIRRSIGEQIAARMTGPDEGTVSEKLAGYKVSVTRKLTRTVDANALSASWGELSENVQRTFKWKAEIVTKHFRALQELKTTELAEVARFITAKPAATAVSVEALEAQP